MKVNIEYNPRAYNKNHKNANLLKLIIENINLLIAISSMDIKKEMKKKANETCDINQIVDETLEDLILSGQVEEYVATTFKQLWISTSDENLGILLEDIIAQCGPYVTQYKLLGCSRECKVVETKKENDFDVVFYDENLSNVNKIEKLVEVCGCVEFHECKKNVCNVIPCNKELLKDDFKRKLEFIKDVHNLVNDGLFFIPTFKYNTSGSEYFLKNNGYEFIEILNIKKIVNRFCC